MLTSDTWAGAARDSSRQGAAIRLPPPLATVIQHLPRAHVCVGPWGICFLVLGLKLVLVSPAAVYPALPAPGLSITIWHLPAVPSLVMSGHISEAQTVQ